MPTNFYWVLDGEFSMVECLNFIVYLEGKFNQGREVLQSWGSNLGPIVYRNI